MTVIPRREVVVGLAAMNVHVEMTEPRRGDRLTQAVAAAFLDVLAGEAGLGPSILDGIVLPQPALQPNVQIVDDWNWANVRNG